MGSVVNFNKLFDDRNENIKKIDGFNKKFLKKLQNNIDNIKEHNNVLNLELLLNRYNDIIELFKSIKIDKDELNLFLERLNTVCRLCDNDIDYVYFVLYFFNSYKIYGSSFIYLSDYDIQVAMHLYSMYEQEENIKQLDNLLDGLFEPELINRLKKICKNDKSVIHNYSAAYDEYFENIEDNIPFTYFFKNYINSYEECQKEKQIRGDLFSKCILAAESVYNEIKENVEGYAGLLHYNGESRKDKEQIEQAIDIMNALDTMVFKLKNIEEPIRTECLIYIREIWTNGKNNLRDKINFTFDEIEKLYNEKEKAKKNKK